MKAIQASSAGAPLQLNDVAIPRAGKGQVVVKQRYSSINPMDNKIHKYNSFGAPLPFTLGWDACGTISEIGEGVTRFSVGDEVFGLTPMIGGGFAEYVVCNENDLAKRTLLPADIAGASSVVFGTAWQPLYLLDDLKKRKGQTIFIPGGGGGIGHLAVQLAKWSGLRVIASASKAESIQLSKECGADHVINYTLVDVVEEVLKLTNNEGVDIAFDATYVSSSFTQSARVVKKGGSWIRVGSVDWNSHGINDEEAREVCKQREVKASSGDLGRYWSPEFASRFHEKLEILAICDKIYADGVSARVTQVVPFYDVESLVKAEALCGSGKISGKVVVKIEK